MKLDNRISLQKLEVLCLVVELGGVHRAAERLFVAQPVVSAHLRPCRSASGHSCS
ncbi:helix-turn-helix domain-containing protein [Pseudonocardia nigra]|uniref:helix-turn-helix domain-containing protein n=1 Tax=Pseudonocardia nigra TaxID=1921578 RepID=UPI001C5CC542|nr:LysR family transcriptional regulator [Pseudonocardia nigra]